MDHVALSTPCEIDHWLAASQMSIIKLISANRGSCYMQYLGCKRVTALGFLDVVYPSTN